MSSGNSAGGRTRALHSPLIGRRPDIQGIRALAVIAVIAFHAGLPVPGGFIGVDVFFVISGFVIAGMLYREWCSTGRLRLGQFYLRRFKRLTPALALVISVVMIASVFILSPLGPQQNAAKTAIGAILLVANFVIERTSGGYFDVAAELNPLLNTWSLSVEEQFYLVFPVLVALGWYLARRSRVFRVSPYVIVGGMAALSFGLAVVGSFGNYFYGSRALLGFYSPFTRAWEFAAGALLALVLARHPVRAPGLLSGASVLGVLLLGVGLWSIGETTPFPGPWTLLPVSASLLLLVAGANPSSLTTRILSSRPMVKVGDWSYSLYLWHWPFIVFAVLLWPDRPLVPVLAALASTVPALASYRYVEEPIRSLGNLSSARWTRLAVTTGVVPAGLAIALLLASSAGWWSQEVRQLQAATIPFHIGLINNCDERAPVDPQGSGDCVWNRDAGGPPLYMLGDSNADHFSEGFIAAGEALNRPVQLATTNSCPFVDVTLRITRTNAVDVTCRNYVEQSLSRLEAAPPGLVVISNSDAYWSSTDWAIDHPPGGPTVDRAIKLDYFESALRRVIERLRIAGHQVLLVHTVPYWSDWDPSLCSLPTILRGSCASERPLIQAVADHQDVRTIVELAASEEGGTVWDPALALCPEALCNTDGPGFIRYRDAGHISVPQSKALAPAIEVLVDRLSGR